MELRSKPPTSKGPASTFTGDVWIDPVVRGEAPSRVRVNTVRFSPGARTAWHRHGRGQTLYVTEGAGLVQTRGGEAVRVRAGDVVYAAPEEEHWHGATDRDFLVHLSITEAVSDDRGEADWHGHVTDEEYRAAQP
jgi:quercetin dioxygenase-like cupin family protein